MIAPDAESPLSVLDTASSSSVWSDLPALEDVPAEYTMAMQPDAGSQPPTSDERADLHALLEEWANVPGLLDAPAEGTTAAQLARGDRASVSTTLVQTALAGRMGLDTLGGAITSSPHPRLAEDAFLHAARSDFVPIIWNVIPTSQVPPAQHQSVLANIHGMHNSWQHV